ncbi:hypothetical protein RAB80_001856 [Fusarium oxysporum f. sp. vasinfectum]|nr:hypothetical protein RAB80_001856 [Fusarium oxysporum f. sp. vasinfectum]
MARNSEKAQSMLFRFREAQAADLGIIDAGRTRRPKLITEVSAIPACEKWHPILSDYQIRDLNDEINKLMREKHMWEIQIRNLGGPNYMRGGGKIYDEQGREIPGSGKGYKYFGRARELPGVKELFEAAKNQGDEKPLEERHDMRRNHLLKTGSKDVPEGWEPLPGDSGDGITWDLPTLEEVQEELIDRRRRRLLEQL